MDKLKFYTIDRAYLTYLKSFDSKVPDYEYSTNAKFYCGVVVNIGDYNYFAPVSSFTQKQQTNFLIKHKDDVLSSIRFSFMIPVPSSLLSVMDFSILEEKYKGLVIKEYEYCNDNKEKINELANRIYIKALNRGSFIGSQCCNFKLLEEKYDQYLIAEVSRILTTSPEALQETAGAKEEKPKESQ